MMIRWLFRDVLASIEGAVNGCEAAADRCEAALTEARRLVETFDADRVALYANQLGQLIKVMRQQADQVFRTAVGLDLSQKRLDAILSARSRGQAEALLKVIDARVGSITTTLANLPIVEVQEPVTSHEWTELEG